MTSPFQAVWSPTHGYPRVRDQTCHVTGTNLIMQHLKNARSSPRMVRSAPFYFHVVGFALHTKNVNLGIVSRERVFFVDNQLVRIRLVTETIWRASLVPWEFEFSFPGSLISTFLASQPTLKQTGTSQFTEVREDTVRRGPRTFF